MYIRPALLTLLLAFPARSGGTEVPKGLAEAVRFVEADASAPFDQHRFLLAIYYTLDALHIADKPLPRILVVHAGGNFFSSFLQIKDDRVSLLHDTSSNSNLELWEIWVGSHAKEKDLMSAIARIILNHYQLKESDVKEGARRALRELDAQVDAKSLRSFQ